MATTTVEMTGDKRTPQPQPQPSPSPAFHDFMGMARSECEASVKSSPATVPAANDTASVCSAPARLAPAPDPSCSSRDSAERVSAKNGVLQSHGSKSAFRRPEVEIVTRPCASAGASSRKREGYDSSSCYNNNNNSLLHINQDPMENTRSPKMSKFDTMEENRGGKQTTADDFLLAVQSMQRSASSNHNGMLQAPSVSKSEAVPPKKWESPSLYGPSRLGKTAGFDEKIPCATAPADNACAPSFSCPAADEGSRTGLQGSSLANLIANNNGAWPSVSKSAPAPGNLPSRSNHWLPVAGSDSAAPSGRKIGAAASSQLTIFYGGQAHVFDDVSQDKAEAIIGLAGSSGRSWSTTYSPQGRSSLQPSTIPSFNPNNT